MSTRLGYEYKKLLKQGYKKTMFGLHKSIFQNDEFGMGSVVLSPGADTLQGIDPKYIKNGLRTHENIAWEAIQVRKYLFGKDRDHATVSYVTQTESGDHTAKLLRTGEPLFYTVSPHSLGTPVEKIPGYLHKLDNSDEIKPVEFLIMKEFEKLKERKV